MNIKRFVCICVCLAAVLSVSVFAAVNIDDYAFYSDDGSLRYDMDAYHYDLAQDMIQHSGFDLDPYSYFVRDPNTGEFAYYDYDSFLADYDAIVESFAPADTPETPIEITNNEPVIDNVPMSEMEQAKNELLDLGVSEPVLENILETPEVYSAEYDVAQNTYNYIINDLRGSNFDPSKTDIFTFTYGETEPLWSNDLVYLVTRKLPSLDDFLSIEITANLFGYSYTVVLGDLYPDIDSITEPYFSINDIVFIVLEPCSADEFDFPSEGVYCLSDYSLEIADVEFDSISIKYPNNYIFDIPVVYSAGLKGVIERTFGNYQPYTEPVIYTEVIGNDVVINILDGVSDGAAGVDFAYLSGVFLFAIMLFCLFKLLGGILS